MADYSLDALVLRSRERTPLTTANVRRPAPQGLWGGRHRGHQPHRFRPHRRVPVGFSVQLLRCSGNNISPLTAERLDFPNIL